MPESPFTVAIDAIVDSFLRGLVGFAPTRTDWTLGRDQIVVRDTYLYVHPLALIERNATDPCAHVAEAVDALLEHAETRFDQAIARVQSPVYVNGELIGFVSPGSFRPQYVDDLPVLRPFIGAPIVRTPAGVMKIGEVS